MPEIPTLDPETARRWWGVFVDASHQVLGPYAEWLLGGFLVVLLLLYPFVRFVVVPIMRARK